MGKYNTPKRKIVIMTRLSESEKEIFDNLQREANLSQANFIRKCVLQKSFRIKKIIRNEINTDDFKKLIGDLGKVGNNLNQIAKGLNEGWQLVNLGKTLSYELLELEKMKELLVKCVEKNYGDN
jgi:hypothetical protein